MEPLIQSVTRTLAQDMRELARAPQLEPPLLLEKDPPNWRWHLPLGFVTLAAAGVVLIAAAAVQTRVQERRSGARHVHTKMHKARPRPALPQEGAQTPITERASLHVPAWAATESSIGFA
ncbi:MAG TPA: hypothetical protein VMK66_14185 [Myxococcales bacterium]|nr:hypothetical protein [Myxococcales bacterium]